MKLKQPVVITKTRSIVERECRYTDKIETKSDVQQQTAINPKINEGERTSSVYIYSILILIHNSLAKSMPYTSIY